MSARDDYPKHDEFTYDNAMDEIDRLRAAIQHHYHWQGSCCPCDEPNCPLPGVELSGWMHGFEPSDEPTIETRPTLVDELTDAFRLAPFGFNA